MGGLVKHQVKEDKALTTMKTMDRKDLRGGVYHRDQIDQIAVRGQADQRGPVVEQTRQIDHTCQAVDLTL